MSNTSECSPISVVTSLMRVPCEIVLRKCAYAARNTCVEHKYHAQVCWLAPTRLGVTLVSHTCVLAAYAHVRNTFSQDTRNS